MRQGRLLLATVLACLIAQGAGAALPACTTPAEREAMTVRAFQSYLMVAAVACNQAQAYNGFASRFGPELSAEGRSLKGYFRRVYGGGGESHLNDFITGLANAWSQVHMADMGGYCKETWETMWRLGRGAQPDRNALLAAADAKAAVPSVAATMCAGAASTADRRVTK